MLHKASKYLITAVIYFTTQLKKIGVIEPQSDSESGFSLDRCGRIIEDNAPQKRREEKELTEMPRPKGSKNKVKAKVEVAPGIAQEEIEEKIAAAEAEIAALSEQLKAKKAELKTLAKAKLEAEKAAAEKKAAEDKKKLLSAVEASGKSIEEILEMLK